MLLDRGCCTSPRCVQGTGAGFKNELLFSQFGINYAHLPEQFRKGSVVIREHVEVTQGLREDGTPVERVRTQERVLHCDIIGQQFWDEHPQLLGPQ
jgi:tRNA(His) guanylyltransferase